MPDLKTELSKVLNEWNKPEATTMTHRAPVSAFKPTNNVCRATFDCIKHNPGKTRIEIAALLEASGYKRSSTTSLMGQMVKQEMVRSTGGLLFTTVPEYVPIKSHKVWANQTAKKPQRKIVTLVNKRTGEVINPKPQQETAPLPPNLRFSATVPELLETMSIVQARELYDALRKIFGG